MNSHTLLEPGDDHPVQKDRCPRGLKISLATLAIATIGIPMSMVMWVAFALIGY